MKWIDRLLHHRRHEPPKSVLSHEDRSALASEKKKIPQRLNAADEAVRKAMEHADDVFRGPERRREPR